MKRNTQTVNKNLKIMIHVKKSIIDSTMKTIKLKCLFLLIYSIIADPTKFDFVILPKCKNYMPVVIC